MGIAIVISWFALAGCIIAIGELIQNRVISGIGAAMVLMVAMLNDIAW